VLDVVGFVGMDWEWMPPHPTLREVSCSVSGSINNKKWAMPHTSCISLAPFPFTNRHPVVMFKIRWSEGYRLNQSVCVVVAILLLLVGVSITVSWW